MKKNRLYAGYDFFGKKYLMPFGQNIADHKKGISLNDSCAFLIKLLEDEKNFDEIVDAFKEEYSVPEEESCELEKDLEGMLFFLTTSGFVEDNSLSVNGSSDAGSSFQDGLSVCGSYDPDSFFKDRLSVCSSLKNDSSFEESAQKTTKKDSAGRNVSCEKSSCEKSYYMIGPLCIGIEGDQALVHEYFEKFKCGIRKEDQIIRLCGYRPPKHPEGTVLIRSNEIIVTEINDRFIVLFLEQKVLYEQHISKNGDEVTVYYVEDGGTGGDETGKDIKDAVYHALRFSFALAAQYRGLLILHSASILYDGVAWLFSGSSGTGKSTHTDMWNRYYAAPVLNGDLNMIGIEGEKVMVYGLPWCGTSGICTEHTYELGGVVFLTQDKSDFVKRPEKSDAAIMFIQRIISPMWTLEQFLRCAEITEKTVGMCRTYRLFCTKYKSAVDAMKDAIDRQ